MYTSLPQINPKNSEFPISENTSRPNNMPMEFLSEVVFAGGIFWNLEAVFGRVDGVLKTATGNCGGTVEKPTYREVCEGTTGHTEAVKVIYDNRKISYKSLLDSFWDFHDPTNKNYLIIYMVELWIKVRTKDLQYFTTRRKRGSKHRSQR
ncbi:uncharacterized protein LOC142631041 [Castanea sativa]|uniref:uncharacterized protein LOC142631041 n=1 Tax=Castanea sativa TaxID=21020 RepID=UPI003F653A38